MRFSRHSLLPAGIALVAFAVRLWFAAPFTPNPAWADPDGYLQSAARLADGSHSWHWTLSAVEYAEFFKAPLYPTVLSAFTAGGPGAISPPRWLFVAHAALDACAVLALYFLGCWVHTRRAGLIASALYAVWIPSIRMVAVVRQEHLYIPLLVVAFALLARALDRAPRLTPWALAGAAFGLAALTRSSVAYYLPVAAGVYALARPTSRKVVCAAALMAGFIIVVAPYVACVSRAAGHFVLIEDIGTFALKRAHAASAADPTLTITRYMTNPSRGPTGEETLRFLLADFAAGPASFLASRFDELRLVWKPAGGSMVQDLLAPGRVTAALWKAGIHLGIDLPFVVAAVLWPLGALFSRRRATGALLALWIAEFTALLALTGWAGARFRAPIEPALLLLAAVVLSGGWRRPRRAELVGAVTVTIVATWLVGLSFADTVSRRATYGLDRWPLAAGESAQFEGRAGFTLHTPAGTVELVLRDVSPRAERGPINVRIEVSGKPADRLMFAPGEVRPVRYVLNRGGNPYVEIDASTASGQPASMRVEIR